METIQPIISIDTLISQLKENGFHKNYSIEEKYSTSLILSWIADQKLSEEDKNSIIKYFLTLSQIEGEKLTAWETAQLVEELRFRS